MQSKCNPNVKRLLKSVQAECRPVASWSATSKSLHPDVIKDPMHSNKGNPLKFKPAGKLKIKNISPRFWSLYLLKQHFSSWTCHRFGSTANPFSAPCIIQKLIMVSFSEKKVFHNVKVSTCN